MDSSIRNKLAALADRAHRRRELIEDVRAGLYPGLAPATALPEPPAKPPNMLRSAASGGDGFLSILTELEADLPGLPAEQSVRLPIGREAALHRGELLARLLLPRPASRRRRQPAAPPSPSAPLSPFSIAFLDTESTGLGGAGVVAFLVAVGWFEPARGPGRPIRFRLEQYLIEDFCQEPAMLERLVARLSGFSAVCTYNGRGFDMPLLRTRAILNRMKSPVFDLPNLDLLPISRRLWKGAIGSCSLKSVERHILGIDRGPDIDGAEIPAVFHEWCREGREDRMEAVLRHNAQDVASLGSLLAGVMWRLEEPESALWRHASERIGLGAWLADFGETMRGLELQEHGAAMLAAPADRVRHAVRIACDWRRAGRAERGAEGLRAALSLPIAHSFEAWERIAIHLEHVVLDVAGAMAHMEECERRIVGEMELADALGRLGTDWRRMLEAVARRRDRLAARRSPARRG